MRPLAPDLFDRRFQDLMEMGRASLPGLAPDWTDHNAHDPGITLMELLAWVAEAQMYSLGHMRRDEREAYAALLGLAPAGTQPARGLIWPDHADASAPVATYSGSRVIPADAAMSIQDADAPTFRPTNPILWIPGHVRRLYGRLANGRMVDYTVINERGGPAFLPFGSTPGRRDVLVMDFDCRGDEGLFPTKREDAKGALWPIGVRADIPFMAAEQQVAPATDFAIAGSIDRATLLTATLVTATERVPLRIAADSSCGLLRTGALLLDLSAVQDSPRSFSIELQSPRGFARPPRLLRIEPNVMPIVQGRSVRDELNSATGFPDWSFQLAVPGLQFAPFEAPLKVELRDANANHRSEWRSARLAESGPNDEVYEFDIAQQRITFGNGVNGRIPPAGAQVLTSYTVSDGANGMVAANRRWRVRGFVGAFGINVDAVAGAASPTGLTDERREARRLVRDDHALVSDSDIETAALALPLLEVARARVAAPSDKLPRTGIVTLIAMRARSSEEEAGSVPETRLWLEAIHRRLTARVPLGTRLVVKGPRYIDFSVRAVVEAVRGSDPNLVKIAIENELRTRFALVGDHARDPGVPISKRDVTAWIRVADGVRRVTTLHLVPASGTEVDELTVPHTGLPRFDFASTTIDVRRSPQGGAP